MLGHSHIANCRRGGGGREGGDSCLLVDVLSLGWLLIVRSQQRENNTNTLQIVGFKNLHSSSFSQSWIWWFFRGQITNKMQRTKLTAWNTACTWMGPQWRKVYHYSLQWQHELKREESLWASMKPSSPLIQIPYHSLHQSSGPLHTQCHESSNNYYFLQGTVPSEKERKPAGVELISFQRGVYYSMDC